MIHVITIRIRSLLWFGTGVLVALALLGGSLAFRAEAAPGPGESTIVSVTPARVLDTRNPTDLGLAGPFVSPTSLKLRVTGVVPTATGPQTVVPIGATGVLLNVTVVEPTARGFLSVRPGDAVGPATTSSLNFDAGQIVPNAVQVALPTSGPNAGTIDITYNAFEVVGPVADVLVDVVGYTTAQGIQDLVADLATKAPQTQIPRAESVKVANVATNFTFGTPLTVTSVQVTAPVNGVIQAVGGFGANGLPSASRMTCSLSIGSTVAGSSRTVDLPASGLDECTTVGSLFVPAGTHTVSLIGSGATGINPEAASLNVLFVPNGSDRGS